VGTEAPLGAATLVALGVELVVVGGCALLLHDAADRCGDLDIVPEPSAANLDRLCRALGELRVKKPPSARLLAANPLMSVSSIFGPIDIMIATAKREYAELARRADRVPVGGVPVPLATVADALRLRAEFKGSGHE
jgi:hypothetical protein